MAILPPAEELELDGEAVLLELPVTVIDAPVVVAPEEIELVEPLEWILKPGE